VPGEEVETMKSKKQISIQTIAIMGVMTALVFASNYIQITIPVAMGPITRIHVANGICLLAALLFGGFKGGIAAGVGSFLYDLTSPVFAPISWITLITKFLLAFICGVIVYLGTNRDSAPPPVWRKLIGAVVGALSYVAMYCVQMYYLINLNFFKKDDFEVLTAKEVWAGIFATNLPASLFNAAIGITIAVLLHSALRPALERAKLREKFDVR